MFLLAIGDFFYGIAKKIYCLALAQIVLAEFGLGNLFLPLTILRRFSYLPIFIILALSDTAIAVNCIFSNTKKERRVLLNQFFYLVCHLLTCRTALFSKKNNDPDYLGASFDILSYAPSVMALDFKRSEAHTLRNAKKVSSLRRTVALQAQRVVDSEKIFYECMLKEAYKYNMRNGDREGVMTQVVNSDNNYRIVKILPLQISAPQGNRELDKLYDKHGQETNERVEVIEVEVIEDAQPIELTKTKAIIAKWIEEAEASKLSKLSKVSKHTVVASDFFWRPCGMGYPSVGLYNTMAPGYGTPLRGEKLAKVNKVKEQGRNIFDMPELNFYDSPRVQKALAEAKLAEGTLVVIKEFKVKGDVVKE